MINTKQIMKSSKTWLISLIMITVDILILFIIFLVALHLRRVLIGPEATWERVRLQVQLGVLYSVVGLFVVGLYPGYGLTAVKELELTTKAISLSFFALTVTAYLNKPFQIFSRSIIIGSWAMALLILPLLHFLLRNVLSRMPWYRQYVHLFGEQELSKKLKNSFKRVPRMGWEAEESWPLNKVFDLDPYPGTDIAILALPATSEAGKYVRVLSQYYRHVILVRDGAVMGSLYVIPRDFEGRLGIEFQYNLLSRRVQWLKRLIDIVGAVLLSFFMFPFVILIAVLIRMDTPGPIIYRQERLGKHSQLLNILKFRTMVVEADQLLNEILQSDQPARMEYEKYHKLEADPRVTRVGRWLRRHSLDELPQLWHVVTGRMSLVGPRPYLAYGISEMESFANSVLRVKPGMTGWWQVLGRHNTTFLRRLQMDEYYISNWSIWMDIYILLKTAGVVFFGKGA